MIWFLLTPHIAGLTVHSCASGGYSDVVFGSHVCQHVSGGLHMSWRSQAFFNKTEPECLESAAVTPGPSRIAAWFGNQSTSGECKHSVFFSGGRWRGMMDEGRLQNMNSGGPNSHALSGLSVMDVSISFRCLKERRSSSLLNKSLRSPSCLAVSLRGFIWEKCAIKRSGENSPLSSLFFH